MVARTLLAAVLGVLVAGCDSSAAPEVESYLVEVSGETFRVRVSDPAVIAALDARLDAGTEGVISGRLVAGHGGWNRPWSWRLDPATVHAPQMAIELCDGRPSMVEADTSYWLRTVKQYCPWGATVIRRE
jgi:hypothetical protein